MKTYVCDMCKEVMCNPVKVVDMRELSFHLKPSKKEKIHLCRECWFQVVELSRKKRSDTE
jgi:hypothetical protein